MRVEREKNTVTVFLEGELDHCNAQQIRRIMDQAIMDKGIKCLIVDMEQMAFMDSSGIAVVINAFRLMAKMESKLEIAALGQQQMKVLHK